MVLSSLQKPIAVIFHRLSQPIMMLVMLLSCGTLGYYTIGILNDQPWTLLDCAYMTSITMTTVGYSDVLNADAFLAGRIYNMLIALLGLSGTLYATSALTAFLVDGSVRKIFEASNMDRRISSLRKHTVICGLGQSGKYVALEHIRHQLGFVIIEQNKEVIETFLKEYPDTLYVQGDATLEECQKAANIEHAKSFVATLSDDKSNLFLVITARELNREVQIVARCDEARTSKKLMAAGANHVINPYLIGGSRIAKQVISPHLLDLIDIFSSSPHQRPEIFEVELGSTSPLLGSSMLEAQIEAQTRCFLVGIKKKLDNSINYQPSSAYKLTEGDTLILLGPSQKRTQIENLLNRHE